MDKVFNITNKEKRIIELIRSIPFGELKIYLQDKQPLRVEKIESEKL
jgi:hypothetical protein